MDIQLREEVRAVRCMTQQVWRRLSSSKYQLWKDFYIDDTNIFFFPYQPLCFPVVVLSPCPNHVHYISYQSSSYTTISQVNIRSVFFPTSFLALKHSSLDPISMIHAQLFFFSFKQLVKLLPTFYLFFPPPLVTTLPISYSFIPAKNLTPFVRLRK